MASQFNQFLPVGVRLTKKDRFSRVPYEDNLRRRPYLGWRGVRRVSWRKATAVASEYGMVVVKGVTKKLDYLVMADPDSLSGKAKKARS